VVKGLQYFLFNFAVWKFLRFFFKILAILVELTFFLKKNFAKFSNSSAKAHNQKKTTKTWLLAFSLSFFEKKFCGDFEAEIFCCKFSFLRKK
jgi:hypothetical protein